ncbi:MAG: hypothetical protein PHE93_05405 [Clostridia bacterium]|nr:hypothetical protein [Clostridia bacterium]
MKKVFIIILASLLSLSVFVFTACDNNQEVTPLRFVMPDGSTALSVAKLVNDGCTIDGEKVEIEAVTANLIGTEVAGEKADIAIMPTNAAANIINQGGEYKIVATNSFGVLHLVGVGTPETFALNDLLGKVVVSIGQSNTPQFVFEAILEDAAIDIEYGTTAIEGKVVINFVADGSGVIGAMSAGTADFGVIGEPAASVIGSKVNGVTKLFDLQEGYAHAIGVEETGFPQAALVIKTSLLEERPEFVEKLLVALEENIEWVNNDDNKAGLTSLLATIGSVTTFPSTSIAGCNIRLVRANSNKTEMQNYLSSLFGITLGDDAFYVTAD